MKTLIKADNSFVTRITENTVYEVVNKLELSINDDQNILIDEIINLTDNGD